MTKRSKKTDDGTRPLSFRIWYRVCWFITRAIVQILYRTDFQGSHNIPKTGPCILTVNHQSHLDPPISGIAMWRRGRYLARKTLFNSKTLAVIMRSWGVIPLDTDGTGIEGVKRTLRALKAGELVVVFPEGARSHDGETHEFMPGFITFARHSKAPIVPSTLEGPYDSYPRDAKFPKPCCQIHVLIGKPISPEEIAAMSDDELVKCVESKVRELNKEVRSRPAMARQIARRRERLPLVQQSNRPGALTDRAPDQ